MNNKFSRIRQRLRRAANWLCQTSRDDDPQVINNSEIIRRFIDNPDNTFLVSFPRTGSHWLRMLMELYFDRPSLVRAFYFPERRDFLTLHTHDLDLSVVRSHVIYLYREPVAAIYSQLKYHGEDTDDRSRISYWSDSYGRHLDKWLNREAFTEKKTLIRYERLKEDLEGEFRKVCLHFGDELNVTKLDAVAARLNKPEISRRTAHDPRVINRETDYVLQRNAFRVNFSEYVWDTILDGRYELEAFFKDERQSEHC